MNPGSTPAWAGRGGRKSRGRGFTLLEVLVALVILTVALAALIKASSEHTRNTFYLQERLLAHWVGQNLLARYEAGLWRVEAGRQEGRMRQADREWEYQLEIRAEEPDAGFPLPAIMRIEIWVTPADAGVWVPRTQVIGYVLP
jgi:general secretion pathway protein I